MSERTLFEGVALTTQEPEAVNALAAYLGKEISFDGVLELGDMKLVRSNKGDSFYAVTVDGCSCPSFTYRGGPCKHQRRCFAESKPHGHGQSMAETLRQADANLSKMPYQYRRMVQAARDEATAEDEPIPESQCYKAICKPISEEERAARIAAAKAKCEANRQQAREHQARGKASSSPISKMLIDAYAPTTTPGEIEYWQSKEKMEA